MLDRQIATVAAAMSALIFWITSNSNGAFIMNVYDTAQGAVAAGSGTINLTSLTYNYGGDDYASVNPYLGLLISGPVALTPIGGYSGLSGPANFGSGVIHAGPLKASTGSGNIVGLVGAITRFLEVPNGYISGTELSETCLFSQESISYIGLADGTYLYTWGSGPTADSLTINIGTPVPEPASVAVVALPATLALLRRRAKVGRDIE